MNELVRGRKVGAVRCAWHGAAIAAALCATAAHAQDWSFETGTLTGWIRTGAAFDGQRTLGNIAVRRPGETGGQAGNGWIGAFDNRPGSRIAAGTVQGEVDNSSLGHINVDDFRFSDAPIATSVAGAALSPPAVAPVGRVVQGATVGRPALRPPSPDVQPGQPVASARFRVTARGFRVEHQTYDDMFEGDGRGDEVYVRADVFTVAAGASPVRATTARTGTIGHRAQLLGGSGKPAWNSADGEPGGFLNGDTYPTADPAVGRAVAPRSYDLPLAIWEGDLTEGGDSIVVIPTIWEWDGFNATASERRWEASVEPAVAARMADIRSLVARSSTPGRSPPVALSLSLPITDDGTRPIGSPRQQTPPVPMEVTSLVLTYQSALAISQQRLTEDIEREVDGNSQIVFDARPLPSGVMVVRFQDVDGLDGDYVLYLHVECLS